MIQTPDMFAHARDQLNHLSAGVTLAILHPDFHGQHRLLASLLLQDDAPVLFWAVQKPDTGLSTLLSDLHGALEIQLKTRLPDLAADPAKAGAKLAGVLNDCGNATLILDAFDLVDQDEVVPFITDLADRLSPGARLILGGRQLPMGLLEHEELADKTALVPVDSGKMILDYARTMDKNVLEVRALGPGRVLINGRLVEHWDGVLPRTLFFYFVDRGMTTRDEIFRTFWPTLSTREATNVFHVTKRKISEILGIDLTVYWSGFYRVSPELELHYDVVKFAEAVQNAAVAGDDEAAELLQNAIDLYHGPFLSTMDQAWVNERRSELSMTYAEALSGLARIYDHHGVKFSALGCLLRAAATNPQREDLARDIMQLYQELGDPQAALEAYDRLVDELEASLHVAPSARTVELANAIRASL